MLMNQYGIPKKPKKDNVLKLRNKTLRNLIIVARNISNNPFTLNPKEIDDIVIKVTKCNKRTAYEYRTALLEVCSCYFN
jgi:hypothetical protein